MKLWITRNKDCTITLWKVKPKKAENHFYEGGRMGDLNPILYPEITFENSPQQIELISSEEYKHLKECEEICKIESDYDDKHYC